MNPIQGYCKKGTRRGTEGGLFDDGQAGEAELK